MSNLGELLKAERLKKQISYDTITEYTRISEDVIRTLEEGSFDKMPSYVHARNFVKSYASFLRLNLEEVEALFEEECKKEDFNREIHYVASPVTQEPIDKKSPLVYVIIILAALAVFVVGIFIYKSMSNNDALEQKETKMRITPPEVNESEPDKVIGLAESFDNMTDNATLALEGSLEMNDTTDNTTAATVPLNTTTPAVPAAPAAQPVAASTASASSSAPVQTVQRNVTLAFSDVCWVNIETDEGAVFDFIADKGLERTLQFKEYFILNLGNSAVVEVRDGSTRHRGFGEFRKPVRNLRFSYDANGKLVYTRQN